MYMKLLLPLSHVLITFLGYGERFQYTQRLEEKEGSQLLLTDRCDAFKILTR